MQENRVSNLSTISFLLASSSVTLKFLARPQQLGSHGEGKTGTLGASELCDRPRGYWSQILLSPLRRLTLLAWSTGRAQAWRDTFTAGETAQRVQVLAGQKEHLNFISEIHLVEKENQLP